MRRLPALTAIAVLSSMDVAALELEDCRISAGPSFPGINARCGMLERPLDPALPDGDTIELRVAVVPALDLDPLSDPLVLVAGGPGQGTVTMYANYRRAFEPVRRTRDILLVDQRGTGESASLTCDADDEVVEGVLSEEETRELTRECLERLPHDPRFFTTSVAVRDLEAVREALGYPALNLYGVSYGTRVAQHFARRFPASTRTLTIDGVVPPQLPLGPEIATESQRAVDELFDRCEEDEACSTAFPEIGATFDRVLAELDAEPREIGHAHPVSGRFETARFGRDEFAAAIRLLVYQDQTMALVPLLVHEAGKGNYVPILAAFQMAVGSLGESMAFGMHNAVVCTEDIPFYDEARIDYAAIEAAYMGPMQLSALESICSVWPAGVIDEDLREPLDTTLPVLLLSGEADPITPPRYAMLAMERMKNARHIAEPGLGHGLISLGCMPELLAEFIETADPQAPDASCMERSFRMPFFVDFPGPAP